MAIYHLSAQMISRGDGRSSVKASAYRSGQKLVDERTGTECHYTRRQERILHSEILAPADAPAWATDRQTLWNRVEATEKRKDSQLAREIEVSLPVELTNDQHLQLLREFAREQLLIHGLAVDLSIHSDPDRRNPHCHLMVTTRSFKDDGFGPKERYLNSRSQLATWRQAWADHVNSALEHASCDARVDHRSLVDQGIERAPTIHEGWAARRMEQRGGVSERCQINRDVLSYNLTLAAPVLEFVPAVMPQQTPPPQRQAPAPQAPPAFAALREQVLRPVSLPERAIPAPLSRPSPPPARQPRRPSAGLIRALAAPGLAIMDAGATIGRGMKSLWDRTSWAKAAELERYYARLSAHAREVEAADAERRRREHAEDMERWHAKTLPQSSRTMAEILEESARRTSASRRGGRKPGGKER